MVTFFVSPALHADDRLVEPRNDLLGALDEADGVLAFARVEHLSLVVLERVLHLDRGAFSMAGLGCAPAGRGQQHQ